MTAPSAILRLLLLSSAACCTAWIHAPLGASPLRAPRALRHASPARCVASPPRLEEAEAAAGVEPEAAPQQVDSVFFKQIERSLERLTGDPNALLEAVVGLPHNIARYDRDAIVGHWAARPDQMVARALDFLLAFRRIRTAWDAGGEGDDERGAVLRRELAALGPVSVKVGQTLSQRPDILPEDVCEALKALQTSNKPFPDSEAFQVIAEEARARRPEPHRCE